MKANKNLAETTADYPVASRLDLPQLMDRGGRHVVRRIVAGFMKLAFRVRIEGLDHLPSGGPAIIIANHSSYFDIPLIHVFVKPWIYFVAKLELFKPGFPRRFLAWWGAIPLNREHVSLQAARDILGLLRQGRILCIFPEGTRLKPDSDRRMYPPKTGVYHFARKTGARIVPMGIAADFRFRQPVRLTIGPSFTLKDLQQENPAFKDEEAASIEMMRRVYALAGISAYPLTKADYEAERQRAQAQKGLNP
ncbi:MAG: lysophospholipid acyltransferase family protein [Oscillospiraceae bacterium]|nr:lysophospholipid acyltransferase family protein [Oscillospiraceae bacterium]MDD4368631.1 lysophospholipid acyltransferase family protein [Oscillospiraceae bacterium]